MKLMNAVYDLAVSPPTFDFVSFLVSAERERMKIGAAHLRVLIAAGPDNGFRRDRLPPRDLAERRRMLDNIVKPMCALLPSCVTVEEWEASQITQADFPRGWTPDRRIPCYSMDHQVACWKAGCFPLTAGDVAASGLVTITLREADYWPTRNSNVPAWEQLAARLRADGEEVLMIRGGDLPNSFERAKVYESAKLNLFVNNGPAWLATCMARARCLVFKMCAAGAVCVNPEFFLGIGFPVGSQVGRHGHRIVWADDDLETIARQTLRELEAEVSHA